jgi:tetratricopeptide (TPR) repeat protein
MIFGLGAHMTDRPRAQELDGIFQLQKERRFEEALESGARLQAAYPQSHHVHKWVAHVFEAMVNLEEAIRELSEAIVLAPGEPDYYFSRARWRLELGRYDDAIADCDSVIAVESTLGRHYYLGASYFIRALSKARIGDNRGALDDCDYVADDIVFWALGELQSRTALVQRLKARIGIV